MLSEANNPTRMSMLTAVITSVVIIIIRRLRRSAITPPRGLKSAEGSMAMMPAVARAVGEPVSWVIHHTNTNWVKELPTKDNAWPDHTVKKRGFQFSRGGCVVVILRIII